MSICKVHRNVTARFEYFVEDMRATGKKLSPPKPKAQKKKIWVVRPSIRKIKHKFSST